jgi:MoaA/NifB/PqqE/SkfB family radical SAM enzyme
MEFWQRVHWYATSKCNEKCRFCFKPDFEGKDSAENVGTLARQLVDGGIEKVIFTGGDPLLLKNLDAGLKVLHDAEVDTTIHTNGTLLNPKRTKELVGLLDEIAIPIDSIDRETQAYLRRTDCLPKVTDVLERLQEEDIRIGIHTVATARNIEDVPGIYDFLRQRRFDYWKVYEFNPDLVGDKLKSEARIKEIRKLTGKQATMSDGGVNCLFAQYILMEEQMSKQNDKRVQFAGVHDDKDPYFFLDNTGDVHFCNWFLQGERKYIGNIRKEGFETVRDKIVEADEAGPSLYEEAFIETESDRPFWVKAAWDGNLDYEELEALHPRHYEKFDKLSRLYFNRLKRQGVIPEDIDFTSLFVPNPRFREKSLAK